MNYYQKYLKYKIKYLNLLKGGTVPQINCDLLPFENTNINIIYQGRFILKNNDNPDNNYLLNDNYQLEKTQILIKKLLFHTSDLYMLANLNIKLGHDDIPFHVGSLQFNFNIIIGIINYIDYFDDNILTSKDGPKKNVINSFRTYIKNKIFHIDRKTYIFLGISNQNSILNCFSFFNKLHEFLNYILLNEYNQQTFDKLFPNIENIKDFYNIYSNFYKIQNKEAAIKTYLQSSSNIFHDDIKKFESFIKNCNLIDDLIKFKSMFGISLINLILINWIYLRMLRTNLVVGSLSSNLYPINRLNFLENIFQMNEEKIYCYAKQQIELNEEKDINILLLEKIGVPIIPYGQSKYKGNFFSNCVENTMLQLLKILAWKNGTYDVNLLPEGISEDIKNIIKRIDKEPLKIETNEIMDDFVLLLSNIDTNIIYRNNCEYNIASNIENVGNILNYIFNGSTVSGGISNYNDRIFKKINGDTYEYSLKQKDNIIIIDKNSYKINIKIDDGHASIDNKISSIYNLINTYKYLSIIYTFNYTKDDVMNFGKFFINFCKKQNQVIKDYLTNKIINIQNINLKIKNSKDEAGNTCLHIAIIIGNLLKLQEFINKNIVNTNETNNEGKTPMQLALILGQCECFKFFIKKFEDKYGSKNFYKLLDIKKFLKIASTYGHIECIKFLIELGEEKNPNNKDKENCLIITSIYCKIECIIWLLDKGADINYYDKIGNTSLMKASYRGNTKCVKLLIENGANINHANNDGETSLLVASRNGHIECVKLLIEKCANINHANNDGETSLLVASNNHIECVKLLIEKGTNINHANDDGNTSLIIASSNNKIDLVKLLIEKGANINYANNIGDTSIMEVCYRGYIECAKLLIEMGANINHANDYDNTSLIFASMNGRIECAKLLIEKGAYINHVNKSGFSALLYASKNGYSECVKLLIEKNANINQVDKNGKSILSYASENNNIECVKLLKEAGAQ
jgi:ankyrin repeat protein